MTHWSVMRRPWVLLVFGLAVALGGLAGCRDRPEVPKIELGTLLDHVPDLPGMEEPYKLPYVPPNPDMLKSFPNLPPGLKKPPMLPPPPTG